MLGYVKENYLGLKSEIDLLAREYSRDITLVAVTKSGSDEEVLSLMECGASDIGENRPQMLVARRDLLRAEGYSPRLHEIGNLQRNKVKYIIEDVCLIHSVGSFELALEIDKQARKHGRTVPILIEVNSAEEEAKGGVAPCDVEELFLKLRELSGIVVSGLMTMGPPTDDGEVLRPYFRCVKEIFDNINTKYGFGGTPTLSMGMSDSYRVAIEEGATMVRVGSKLFQKVRI